MINSNNTNTSNNSNNDNNELINSSIQLWNESPAWAKIFRMKCGWASTLEIDGEGPVNNPFLLRSYGQQYGQEWGSRPSNKITDKNKDDN